jgi:tetratricopeptide (TPR) repeat protein
VSEGAGDGSGGATGVKPGALTALLQEVAAVPEKSEAEPVSLPPGTVIGRFEIIRELGRGGFGVVYEAKDRDLGRFVALKVVRPGRITEEEGKGSREAEAIARLLHPNLITLFDVGRSDHGPFLVFELLRGKTLDLRIEEGPLPVQEAVHIATEVARGLAHAHAEGVIHRDLKPANVFITNKGQVKILDFGMAHAFGRRRLSGGTPAYMAPEQWEDSPEDERTDVFALGVMLYRMLTGEYPFPEREGKWSSEPATVRKLDVPGAPDLAELVERMLDRTPKERPRDGAAVLAALMPIEERLRARPADGRPPEHAKRRKATLGDLLAELRRRHVFRVMIGYGVFSFAVLQITEPIMHGADLPNWVLKAVLVALVLGFPVAVVLAWVYDLTAQGIRRTPSASGVSLPRGTRYLLPFSVAVAVLVLAAAGGGAWYAWNRTVGGERGAGAGLATGEDGRIPVAVADFENGTTDPELNGLSGMLITSLEQSRRLVVLTRSRLVDLIRQSGREIPARLDESMAREVGRKAGVKALLLATVHRFDDLYAIEMRALDPARDEYLFTMKEEGKGKASVPGMIDRLSQRTRERLHERPADLASARRDVTEVTTSNLTAYEHYFKSRQALDERQFEKAREELKAALRIDPEFALAHYQMSVINSWTLNPELSGPMTKREAEDHLAMALKLSDRLPERERLALFAYKATTDGRWEEARKLRDQAADAYPQDKEAVFWAGDVRFHRGDTVGAIPYFERALRLDPDYRLIQEHLVLALSWLDRPQEQLEWARRWADSSRDPVAYRSLGRALLANDKPEEAAAAFQRAYAIDGFWAVSSSLPSYKAFHGGAAEAEALLRQAIANLPPPSTAVQGEGPINFRPFERASTVRGLLAALVYQGRMGDARRLLEGPEAAGLAARDVADMRLFLARATRSPEDARAAVRAKEDAGALRTLEAQLEAALALALAGDLPAARSIADAGVAAGSTSEFQPYLLPTWKAVEAWRQGSTDVAAAGLREVAESPYVEARFSALCLLGEVELSRGRSDGAVETLERAIAMRFTPTITGAPYLKPAALYSLAVAHERLGDRVKARARIEEFLVFWERADPDLPMLVEAKAMQARLAAGATAQ